MEGLMWVVEGFEVFSSKVSIKSESVTYSRSIEDDNECHRGCQGRAGGVEHIEGAVISLGSCSARRTRRVTITLRQRRRCEESKEGEEDLGDGLTIRSGVYTQGRTQYFFPSPAESKSKVPNVDAESDGLDRDCRSERFRAV